MAAATRAQLNDQARGAGVAAPEKLPNKAAVVAAIEGARRPVSPNLQDLGARVVSVFGPVKARRVLIDMPASAAMEAFPDNGYGEPRPGDTIDATERDIAALRERDEALGDSALAATAMRLAYELDDPFNSATSKSMCARVLVDTMERLRELAPPERKKDRIDGIRDDLAAKREEYHRAAAAADKAGA